MNNLEYIEPCQRCLDYDPELTLEECMLLLLMLFPELTKEAIAKNTASLIENQNKGGKNNG